MSNMSYCRFQNTLLDLRDCAANLGCDPKKPLSEDEAHARRRLIRTCGEILAELKLVDSPPDAQMIQNALVDLDDETVAYEED